jgi:hypothetical protein
MEKKKFEKVFTTVGFNRDFILTKDIETPRDKRRKRIESLFH